jgi:hypothetical protein
MFKNKKNIVTVFIVFIGIILPSFVMAATPSAMLEKSASFIHGNTIYAYRVPTINKWGKLRYYDVVVNLNLFDNGTVRPFANVTSAPALNVATRQILPGTYVETGGTDTCAVTNLPLTNGRIQSLFTCNNGANVFEFSVVNGAVSAGHPFENELKARGVALRSDVNTYSWGFVTGGQLYLGSCLNYSSNYPIGIKTNGNQIIVSLFSGGNSVSPTTFSCGNTLTKQ